MFIFAVLLVHVTKQIAMRTLHIRAKSFGVSLLAAVSALVVWTSVILIRTVAKVPARFAHWTVAAD
jgi:surface polysaccharide O-acyltransferase-like enzyme